MLRIATREYFESLERFRAHLPAERDRELMVLKGHLLVERLLEKYLTQNVANPSALDDARLSFAQKLAFVQALHRDTDAWWLWASLGALNRLRNELAHRLDSARFEQLVAAFLEQVENSPELPHLEPPADVSERLHQALFSVHEALSHRVDL